MAAYEWILTTPRTKEFELMVTTEFEVEEPVVKDGGLPVMQTVKKTRSDLVTKVIPANVARLANVVNDIPHHRLFVRFFYGVIEGGQFKTAKLDDGVVFSGPTYLEHEFHTNPTALEEQVLLKKIAEALKWDGAMRPVST